MRARLIAILLTAAFPAVLLLAQERPGQPGGTGQPGSAAGTATGSVDGTWTVVSAARDGKAVDGADKMTVTIKGNVVTFASGAGSGVTPAGGTPGAAGARLVAAR